MATGFVILLILILSAFFAGSETVFTPTNRIRVEIAARKSKLAPFITRFISNPAKFVTTTLVGNAATLVAFATIAFVSMRGPLTSYYQTTLGLASGWSSVLGFFTIMVFAATVLFLVGHLIPSLVLSDSSDRITLMFAAPLRIAHILLLPMVAVAGWTSDMLMRHFKMDAGTLSQFLRRDFASIIREGKESGELDLDEDESALLTNVFAMSTIRVKDSMVPRTDVIAVEETTTLERLRERFIETGLSKLPVYKNDIDNITGIAFAYDLFRKPSTLAEVVRGATVVPESKGSRELLREFLETNTSIAVVIDEYGGTAGIVTLEDLLEELIGDIRDEFDKDDKVMRKTGPDSYVVSGRVELDELSTTFGITLPEGDYGTVAGYILDALGEIPRTKDEFELGAHLYTVLQASANRIELVRIRLADSSLQA